MHKITPLNPHSIEYPGNEQPIYPEMGIKESDLPAIKDKKIGDEFFVKYKVRVRGTRASRGGEVVADVEQLEIGEAKK